MNEMRQNKVDADPENNFDSNYLGRQKQKVRPIVVKNNNNNSSNSRVHVENKENLAGNSHVSSLFLPSSDDGDVTPVPKPASRKRVRASSTPLISSMQDLRKLRLTDDSIVSDFPKDHSMTVPSSLFKGSSRNKFFKRFQPQLRNRLIQKSGDYNIRLANVQDQRSRYVSDLWTTLVEVKWRWSLLACFFSFILSWLFFAVIYYCILYAHGDLDEPVGSQGWQPCLVETKTFLGVFMFSLETQHTIGYGSRSPSDKCPQVVFTVTLQAVFGVVMQTLLVGVVFAKLTRPKNRAQTLIFSREAVVAARDGRLCFMFRIGDMRKSNLACGSIKVLMIRKHVTIEGEILPYYLYDMPVKVSGVDFCPPFSWPPIVFHEINKSSPLYIYDASALLTAKFEIMVILEGVNSTTGQNCQARTSYLPCEILWGHRFDRLVTYQRENGEYRIDYSKFHSTFPVPTSHCSALDLEEKRMPEVIIDLQNETLDEIRESTKHFSRHDCNMWETPYSTIHKHDSIEEPPVRKKTQLQTLFSDPRKSIVFM